ncbi:MAG: chromate transporter [Clostridiaceae bacterium]|jgi:chromate transporter|nr:chromate transporter [Clostridiaceae bacterium]
MKKDFKTYWTLFTSTFFLSAFTFGGGFVIVPLMKKKFVDELHWIEDREMLDLTAISRSSPGAIAVNASILIGYRIAGFFGALVSTLGTILPPLITLSVISVFYAKFRDDVVINALLKGMQAGVAAVIVDVVINLGNNIIKEKQAISILIMAGAFIATYFLNINVIYIILICGLIGVISTYKRNKPDRSANKE